MPYRTLGSRPAPGASHENSFATAEARRDIYGFGEAEDKDRAAPTVLDDPSIDRARNFLEPEGIAAVSDRAHPPILEIEVSKVPGGTRTPFGESTRPLLHQRDNRVLKGNRHCNPRY